MRFRQRKERVAHARRASRSGDFAITGGTANGTRSFAEWQSWCEDREMARWRE